MLKVDVLFPIVLTIGGLPRNFGPSQKLLLKPTYGDEYTPQTISSSQVNDL